MKIKEKYYRFAEKGHQEQKEYVLWALRHLSV